MDDFIQTDISTEVQITAIRANMCDFFRHISKIDPTAQNKRFTRWYTPLAHPWFSGVLCSDPPTDGDEQIIEESIRFFKNRKTHTFSWWLEPQLRSSVWQTLLAKNGFGFSNDTPGMAMDLNKLKEPEPIEGLEIRPITDEESLHVWAHVFTLGYGLPPAWEKDIFETWLKLGFDHPLHNYLGYLNGQPVSTSSIFFGGGAAGIYNVATLPNVRGKGLGAALTVTPLFEAHRSGWRIGVLQSSEMGFNVYKQLGFEHLCQIEYFYRNAQ